MSVADRAQRSSVLGIITAAAVLPLAVAEHGSGALLAERQLAADDSASRTFYVDPQGSDTAEGMTPGSAWQSVSRVNSESLMPGDSVLFKRGGKWRGESLRGQAGSAQGGPVTYGAYGNTSDPRPLFLGSVSAAEPSIWQTAAAPAPTGTWVANISALHQPRATRPHPDVPDRCWQHHSRRRFCCSEKVWALSELTEQDQFTFTLVVYQHIFRLPVRCTSFPQRAAPLCMVA